VLCNHCTPERQEKGYKKLRGYSFPQFIDHILWQYAGKNRKVVVDVHWRPYNARCFYCDISYNVIGHMETFDDDVQYILMKANLTSLISSDLHVHETGRYGGTISIGRYRTFIHG